MFKFFKNKVQQKLTPKCNCSSIEEQDIRTSHNHYSIVDISTLLNKRYNKLGWYISDPIVNPFSYNSCGNVSVRNIKSSFRISLPFIYPTICLTCKTCLTDFDVLYNEFESELNKVQEEVDLKDVFHTICGV